ncbi:MAG: 4Fe-4S dicluster domain-containing protein [bacterium]
MKYPKLRELKEAVKALIKGPYTSGYPYKPHKAKWGYRGRPTPNDDYCIGCEACARVCPAYAIKIVDEGKNRKILRLYDVCNFCGQCQYWCTTKKGVELTPEYELATTNRKEAFAEQNFEMILCQHCGEKIATKQHLHWIFQKLGSFSYGNPTLLLNEQLNSLPETEISPEIEQGKQRAEFFAILCPKCRHQAYIYDEYEK